VEDSVSISPAITQNLLNNKKALPQSGKNLVTRVFLVEGASEARPRNKEGAG